MSESRRAAACCLLALILMAAGCRSSAPVPEPATDAPLITGLVLQNASRGSLEDVSLTVVETRARVACSVILAGTSCSTTFPGRRYAGREVQVAWTRNGVRGATRPFVVPLPDSMPRDVPLEVVVSIGTRAEPQTYIRPVGERQL